MLWCLAHLVAQAKQKAGAAAPCSHHVILLKILSPLPVYKSILVHHDLHQWEVIICHIALSC